MATGGGNKAILAALFANMGIAVTTFIAFLLTASSSMLAESIHSVADSGNQGLLLLGGRRARRAATPEHPFGYGRERYVYAFVVSIVLFTVGGLFALYEAWHKFAEPHPIESWHWVPVVVLLAAIVMETFSFRTAIVESNAVRGDQGWVEFVRTAKSPELPVVLLEDLGALLGLVFALFGVTLTLVTDDGRWDAVGTAMIGVLLVVIAVVLAIEMKSLLLGESARGEDVRRIETALVGDGVNRIIHMRTMHLGPDELLVGAKIAVGSTDSAAEVARAIDAAERRVRAAVPIARGRLPGARPGPGPGRDGPGRRGGRRGGRSGTARPRRLTRPGGGAAPPRRARRRAGAAESSGHPLGYARRTAADRRRRTWCPDPEGSRRVDPTGCGVPRPARRPAPPTPDRGPRAAAPTRCRTASGPPRRGRRHALHRHHDIRPHHDAHRHRAVHRQRDVR